MTRGFWALPIAMSISCSLERIDIGENVCGNRIIEPANDEDCDGDAPSGFQCGGPTTRGACRFTCLRPRDCPDAWSCGADGVCRAASGNFDTPQLISGPSPLTEIAVAQVDPDEYDDLVQLGELEVQVRFGNERGDFSVAERFNVDVPIGQIETGDLDDSPGSEIVIGQIDGPLFLRGTPNRRLEPIARSSILLPLGPPSARGGPEHARVLAVEIESDVEQQFSAEFFPGRDAILIEALGTLTFDLPFNFLGFAAADLPVQGTALPRAIAIADVDGSSTAPAADEIALALKDENAVFVVDISCRLEPENGLPRLICVPRLKSRVVVDTPIDGGTYFGDLDADGKLDLIVHVYGGLRHAFGLGDGTFCAVSGPICPEGARDRTADAPLVFPNPLQEGTVLQVEEPPLFVGELGFSPGVDFILASHVELGSNLIGYSAFVGPDGAITGVISQTPSFGGFWSQVEVGDFNRDGVTDIAATRETGTLLDVWLGTGTTLYNPFTIPFSHPIGRIAVGDFDGDFFHDVAVYEIGVGVSVVFGSPSGPSDSVLMSRSLNIINMAAVDVVSATSFDLISDLVLTSSISSAFGASGYALTLLNGSSKRRMLAPLTFLDRGLRQDEVFESANIARFDDDSIADVMLTTQSLGDAGTGPANSVRKLWFLAGSRTSTTLPARVIEGENCDVPISCLSQPVFANFDRADASDEALAASICDGEQDVWLIDLQGLKLSCSKIGFLSDDVNLGVQPTPIDVDQDGLSELLLNRGDAIGLGRVDATGTWSLEEISTDGAAVSSLIALKKGMPGADLAFIIDATIYIGSIDGQVLRAKAVAAVPTTKSPISGDGDVTAPDDEQDLLGEEALKEIDIAGDGIPDLILNGAFLLRQLECAASMEQEGSCTRKEVKPR